jgi:hypothetical protein
MRAVYRGELGAGHGHPVVGGEERDAGGRPDIDLPPVSVSLLVPVQPMRPPTGAKPKNG